jgi:hypothetical protein
MCKPIGEGRDAVAIEWIRQPPVDDEPKTAEVISKVLLLARDKEIQDPSILEQMR